MKLSETMKIIMIEPRFDIPMIKLVEFYEKINNWLEIKSEKNWMVLLFGISLFIFGLIIGLNI